MKRFAMLVLIFTLLLSAVAEAKFSDEYKKSHPRRVKVETKLDASGQKVTSTHYTLFKKRLSDGLFMLSVHDSYGIKGCSIAYITSGGTPHRFTKFSWGDGKEAHDIKPLVTYSARNEPSQQYVIPNKYSDYIDAHIRPADITGATIISVHDALNSYPIIYESHKLWKEWQEALDAACQIMKEF